MVHNKHSQHLRPGVMWMMQDCYRFHTKDFSKRLEHPWKQYRTPPHPRVTISDDTNRPLPLVKRKKSKSKAKSRPQPPPPSPSRLRTLDARKRQLSTNITAARRALSAATVELKQRGVAFMETYHVHLDEKTWEMDEEGKIRNTGKFGNCDVRSEFWPESFIRDSDGIIRERLRTEKEMAEKKAEEMETKAKGEGEEREGEEVGEGNAKGKEKESAIEEEKANNAKGKGKRKEREEEENEDEARDAKRVKGNGKQREKYAWEVEEEEKANRAKGKGKRKEREGEEDEERKAKKVRGNEKGKRKERERKEDEEEEEVVVVVEDESTGFVNYGNCVNMVNLQYDSC